MPETHGRSLQETHLKADRSGGQVPKALHITASGAQAVKCLRSSSPIV
jgi:hypothetical protein